ncbi:MAG TPA: GNAT family N-acetyltransferase [Pyrinomonadaceae bacterium]|nr:GNAT family N-acetyltransferase [Pyrinomonadaceae bacterium]
MGIEPFKPSDSAAVLQLHEDAFQELDFSSFLWEPCQQIESLEKDCVRHVYRDEAVKGYGAAYSLDETHFRLNLLVGPRHARRGIGSLLLDLIEMEVRKLGGKYLQARLQESMSESLAFALSRGFVFVHRMRGMSLRAEDFSYEKWKPLGERLFEEGFSATTFKDEEEVGNTPLEKLARLQRRAREGWPLPDPTWKLDATTQQAREPFTHISVPERFSIMKFKDEYVGYTSAEDGNGSVGTGVHPLYRGRGVATYLKAFDIQRCIVAGKEYFESASANPAMLKVNEKLGYKFNELTEVRFVKYL